MWDSHCSCRSGVGRGRGIACIGGRRQSDAGKGGGRGYMQQRSQGTCTWHVAQGMQLEQCATPGHSEVE